MPNPVTPQYLARQHLAISRLLRRDARGALEEAHQLQGTFPHRAGCRRRWALLQLAVANDYRALARDERNLPPAPKESRMKTLKIAACALAVLLLAGCQRSQLQDPDAAAAAALPPPELVTSKQEQTAALLGKASYPTLKPLSAEQQ